MVLAYIKFYLIGWIQSMSILELNKFKHEIDRIIMDRCDAILEEDLIKIEAELDDASYIEPLDDSKVYFREMTHPSEM